jgi:hypothetical protein
MTYSNGSPGLRVCMQGEVRTPQGVFEMHCSIPIGGSGCGADLECSSSDTAGTLCRPDPGPNDGTCQLP